MSRFDLRDISVRLTRSRDIKAVVFEFLHTIEAGRPDWRASLAFYEVSADAFVDVFETEGERLVRRGIVVPAGELPDRLVRKLFDASAIFNAPAKPSLFTRGLGTVPCYVAEERDASELMPLTVVSDWRSCICLPLGDQSDLIGILVITSGKKNAFSGRVMSEILPVKSLVTVALVRHLQRARRVAEPVVREAAPPTEAFSAPPRPFEAAAAPEGDPGERWSGEAFENLTSEFETHRRNTDEYRLELERVKAAMVTLEAQAAAAAEHLAEAYTEMNDASWEMADLERRIGFTRRLLHLLGEETDEQHLALRVVNWLGTEFRIARCSLMTLDASQEVLEISAQCGLDAGLAGRVHVRVGQGVAGWVARNRKPLLVRMRSQADITPEDQADTYNSPSFIAVPVVHNGRLYGVLNLSNKEGGELFDGVDFDCASIAGAALAVRLASCEPARGTTSRAA